MARANGNLGLLKKKRCCRCIGASVLNMAHESEFYHRDSLHVSLSGPESASAILSGIQQHNVRLKLYDPHNHMTGMCHWIGLSLALPENQQLRTQQVHAPAFLSYIELMERRNREGAGERVHGRLKPTDYDLYIYEYMCRSRIMGECVTDQVLLKQLESLRSKLVLATAEVLASPLERSAAQQTQGARMEHGSNTLMPLMMCLQRAHAEMESLTVVIRMVSMMLTASPLVDFDTAYVAREILEAKLGPAGKRDVFRYGLFQLVLNHISYVEMSMPYWLPMPQPDPWVGVPSGALLGKQNPISEHGISIQYDYAAEQQIAWEVMYSEWAREHITVVMLPMMLSTCLAVSTTDPTNSLATHLVGEEPSEIHTGNFGFGGAPGADVDDLAAVSMLLDQPHVRGVDFASPERACYNHQAGGAILRARSSASNVSAIGNMSAVAMSAMTDMSGYDLSN